MSRRPRILYPGAVYHTYTRGNRKTSIFEDDVDRQHFMDLVQEVHDRYEVRYYGLCLMGNHYHLVLETPRANISAAMRQLNGRFAERSNSRHQRTGHLFEGPYSAVVIERDRYLRQVLRYVVRNPVKAGYVKHPADWPWSSYRAMAGLESCPKWLSLDWMPWAFEVDTIEDARRRFVEYVDKSAGKRAINWNAIAFGSPEFESALAEVARRRRAERPLPRATAPPPPPPLRELFLDLESIEHRNRLIQVAHRKHGYSLAEISRYLNLHPGAAARVLRRIESKRMSTA